MLFVAPFGFWGVFPFGVHCLLLLFVARSCFCDRISLSQNQKEENAFGCSFLLFIARFGFFCRCFYLNIALLVLVFCWYERPKRRIKGKKSPNGNQAYGSWLASRAMKSQKEQQQSRKATKGRKKQRRATKKAQKNKRYKKSKWKPGLTLHQSGGGKQNKVKSYKNDRVFDHMGKSGLRGVLLFKNVSR